jgi:hypothetical protein
MIADVILVKKRTNYALFLIFGPAIIENKHECMTLPITLAEETNVDKLFLSHVYFSMVIRTQAWRIQIRAWRSPPSTKASSGSLSNISIRVYIIC